MSAPPSRVESARTAPWRRPHPLRMIWNTARKDWRKQRRNLPELMLWIGIPLIIGGVVVLAFGGGGGGPTPQAHLLVADQDDSLLSGLLLGALAQDEAGGIIRTEPVAFADGRRRIDAGEASALLRIPEGFADAVLDERPTTLELWVNPSQQVLPQLVEQALSLLADAVFYLHRVLGQELRLIAQGPPEGDLVFADAAIGAIAVAINRRVEALLTRLDPLAIELELVEAAPEERSDAPGGFAVLFLPGILVMSLLFMAQGIGNEIWIEHEQHTLRRVVVSPAGLGSFLAGKALAAAGLMLAVASVGLTIGYLYLDLPAGSLPLAVIWAVVTGVMLLGLLTTVQVLARSQRAGQIAGMLVIFPLMMVGGSFFPLEAMPAWMRAAGQITPNGYAVSVLVDVLRGRRAADDMLVPVLIVAALTAAFGIAVTLRMRSFARR
ncbi:MAG: ABC transporter permease [Candidatus Krumholzibacteriia bacterium]